MVLIVAKCIVNYGHICKVTLIIQVLIVAKCIVNFSLKYEYSPSILSINSSKVYCKWFITCLIIFTVLVLIVAKCIVNGINELAGLNATIVLIVAKCIVSCINSSKVYCKWNKRTGRIECNYCINSSKVYCILY